MVDDTIKIQEIIKDKNAVIKSNDIDTDTKFSVISEIIPYILEFSGQTFVVKYGGSAMADEEATKKFAQDAVLLKKSGINVVVVHGGGPQIGDMLNKLGIETEFVEGLRITDKQSVDVVEMVLCGKINKSLVTSINQAGGNAVGMSGKDGNLIKAQRIRKTHKETDSNLEKILDLGFVGEPSEISLEIFSCFEESDIIPVIAPVGYGENGVTYNINADSVAGALAVALEADKLIILSDTDGINDKEGKLISELTYEKTYELIKNKTITGGMIPKVETCLSAINGNVDNVHIINGTRNHALLMEVLTKDGIGTMIKKSDDA